MYKYLDKVNSPQDIKNMTVDELSQFTYCHLSAESVIGLAAKEALRKLNKG